MAKSRSFDRRGQSHKRHSKSILKTTQNIRTKRKVQPAPASLIAEATFHLQTGQPASALPLAQQALSILQQSPCKPTAPLPALNLLGEIYLELGDASSSADCFLQAVELDPDGLVFENGCDGAEKFLWLAQLCEEGGYESIAWFEKGIKVLERDIQSLENVKEELKQKHLDQREQELDEKKRKVAAALCGMVEVWMTDLSYVLAQAPGSWSYLLIIYAARLEPEAEENCTYLINRALLHTQSHGDPYPSTLQTLASLRLSQSRLDDAQSALRRSLALWTHLPPSHPDIPDFPSRISLSRLLMEAEMEEQALEVLEVLVSEDDSSVEGWYLGGWCLRLLHGKLGHSAEADDATEGFEGKRSTGLASSTNSSRVLDDRERKALMATSREWLRKSLHLYALHEYEDERLKEHALELMGELNAELGELSDSAEKDVGDIWESDEDEEEEEDDENQREDEDHGMSGT